MFCLLTALAIEWFGSARIQHLFRPDSNPGAWRSITAVRNPCQSCATHHGHPHLLPTPVTRPDGQAHVKDPLPSSFRSGVRHSLQLHGRVSRLIGGNPFTLLPQVSKGARDGAIQEAHPQGGRIRHEAAWDLMALVIVGGAICTVSQARQKTLGHGWVMKAVLGAVITGVIAFIAAVAMTL
jgi:hypothetical protein